MKNIIYIMVHLPSIGKIKEKNLITAYETDKMPNKLQEVIFPTIIAGPELPTYLPSRISVASAFLGAEKYKGEIVDIQKQIIKQLKNHSKEYKLPYFKNYTLRDLYKWSPQEKVLLKTLNNE